MHLPILRVAKNARPTDPVLHLCVPTIDDLIYSHTYSYFDLMRETIYAEPRCKYHCDFGLDDGRTEKKKLKK